MPENQDYPEPIVSLTIEEAIELQFIITHMDYGNSIWWSYADILGTLIMNLIDKKLIARDYSIAPNTEGILHYFPSYLYTLTETGMKVRNNPDLIDITLE